MTNGMRSRVVFFVLFLGLGGLIGCGGSDGDHATGRTAPAAFARIQLPPRAEPVTPLVTHEGARVRTFTIRGEQPSDVIDFFDASLRRHGWSRMKTGDVTSDARILRTYMREERLLRVTATPAPSAGAREGAVDAVVSQFSLELRRT